MNLVGLVASPANPCGLIGDQDVRANDRKQWQGARRLRKFRREIMAYFFTPRSTPSRMVGDFASDMKNPPSVWTEEDRLSSLLVATSGPHPALRGVHLARVGRLDRTYEARFLMHGRISRVPITFSNHTSVNCLLAPSGRNSTVAAMALSSRRPSQFWALQPSLGRVHAPQPILGRLPDSPERAQVQRVEADDPANSLRGP